MMYLVCSSNIFLSSPEKHPKEFGNLFHALDVWHKSVKLSKKLAKVLEILVIYYIY